MVVMQIGLSTSSVYPFGVEEAFYLARQIGYDGVEIMVTNDADTHTASRLRQLSREYRMPILSIHSPVYARTQLMWGLDPRRKVERSAQLAIAVGAPTVVVHPPYRWQGRFARDFELEVARITEDFGITVSVENMFPLAIAGFDIAQFTPSHDPVKLLCDALTLDFSHAAMAGRDALELTHAMGDRLHHIHLTDGTTSNAQGRLSDEHLVPGRGTQPVAEVLRYLASAGWNGSVVAEVATAGHDRRDLLIETLHFARKHTAAPRSRERAKN